MASTKEEWVEEMFPPTFHYTLDEILSGPTDKKTKDSEPSVFQRVAHNKISDIDVDAIKNVYERVWLMTYLKEKAESEKEKEGNVKTTEKSESKCHKAVGTSASFPGGLLGELDVQDSCIWSSKEIEVLREIFKRAKHENAVFRSSLKETQDQLIKSEKKLKAQDKVLESRTKVLNEAKKANERMKILSDNLKIQLDKSNKTVELLHDEVQELRQNQLDLSKQVHILQLQLAKEQIEHKHLAQKLESQHQEARRDLQLHQEHLKLLHQQDIDHLNKKILDLKQELEKEKQDHSRSKRGLEHLRKYFANVPLQGEEAQSQGVVSQSQLKKWTY